MEFDIKSLIKYAAGATKNEKKYNQNHFLINFSHRVSSFNIFDSCLLIVQIILNISYTYINKHIYINEKLNIRKKTRQIP